MPAYKDSGFEEEIYGRLVESAQKAGALTVTASVRDDDLERNEALGRLGFHCVMRSPLTRLDLKQFDAAGFAPTLRKVEEQGVAIRSVAELKEEGEEWLPTLHELMNDLWEDVPRTDPDPPARTSLEDLREEFYGPTAGFLAGRLVALDGERCVGYSCIVPAGANAEVASTGLTGVARSNRRRGIETALKVAALERVKQEGVRFVLTGNEENNPMLQLNLRLGFRQVYATLTYRKTLAPA